MRPRLPPELLGVGRSYGAVIEDRAGEWWIPAGDRLYRFPKVARVADLATTAPRAVYSARDGLAGGDISRVFEDSRGDLWFNVRIPSGDVVSRWDRVSGTFHRYGEAHGLPPRNPVSGFAEDRTGVVWLSFFEGGLAKFADGRFEWIPGFEGTTWTGAVFVDRRNRLWVGTQRDVRRLDDPSRAADVGAWQVVPALVGYRALAIMDDADGNLFMNTEAGLIRWDLAGDRPSRVPSPGATARADGFTMARDSRGVIWLAGSSGVTAIRPAQVVAATDLAVRIGSIAVNGRSMPIDDLGQSEAELTGLASGDRQVQIGFFALGRRAEDVVRFHYRLGDGDAAWGPPSPVTSVDFARLSPGRYRFEVRPVEADGEPAGQSAIVHFDIPPPLWARWWVLASTMAAVIAGGIVLHRRRVARAVELERIRTSIASDLHDDIGANLSQISLLSEMLQGRGAAADPAAASTLASIADLSRESVDAMGDIVWAIDPHKDHLASLTSRMRRFASELLDAHGVAVDFRFDGVEDVAIGADVRRHVYLAFKEAVNNAAKHSGATRLVIALVRTHAFLELTVSDDGRGFDVAGPVDGHGLRSLARRAAQIGGSVDVRSAPGAGTTVVVRVPA